MRIAIGIRALLYIGAAMLFLPQEVFAHEGLEEASVSRLAGIPLYGAHGLTEPAQRQPIVAQLSGLARGLGRSCRDPEALVWIADASGRASARKTIDRVVGELQRVGYETRLQDGGRTADSDLTILTAVRRDEREGVVTLAGVFAAGDEALLLGWCRLGVVATVPGGDFLRWINRCAVAVSRRTDLHGGEAMAQVIGDVVRARKSVAQARPR